MGRRTDECIELKEVEVGVDSDSGLAVSVKIEDEWHWIPYSQVEEIHRDPRSHDNDRIVITKWLAEKKGLI
jgi:hypothetical protein